MGKLVSARALRSFAPPTQTVSMPHVAMLMPVDILPVATIPMTIEMSAVADEPSAPPPPQRVRGVRLLLKAVAYPFKKIGSGLAN